MSDKKYYQRIIELEDELGQCRDLFRTTFESTGNATIIMEEDTKISFANQDFEVLSGFSRGEIEGIMSWTSFVSADDLPQMLEYHRIRREDPTSAPRNYEFIFIDRRGAAKNIYMTVNMVPGSKRSIGSFTNITDMKRLESEILKVSEQERHELGNDLHDGLSPHLVGVQFMLQTLKKTVAMGKPLNPEFLDEINSLIGQALDHARNITRGLMPVDIQSDGLMIALEELLKNTEKIYGVTCRFSLDAGFALDNIAATHLYYIVREAITNAIKHGRCNEITVNVESYENYLTLSIRDNGIGMPEFPEIHGGIGLSSMKYRARIIGATFDVLKNESGGVTVFCRLKKDDHRMKIAPPEPN